MRYGRRVDLADATASLIAFEAALEDGTAAGDGERQRVVAGYNKDDCRAKLALRDWLEERRAELAGQLGEELPRLVFAEKPGAAENRSATRGRHVRALLQEEDHQERFRFGRETDGHPAGRWGWEDLD